MAKAIGIDLGTARCVVSVWESGRARVVPNADNSRMTPAVVAYTAGGRCLVGHSAQRQAMMDPQGTVTAVKRFLGRRRGEEDALAMIASCPLTSSSDGAIRLIIGGNLVSPEGVAADLLGKVLEDAGDSLGEKISEAVITVPAHFGQAQRRALKRAAESAGLQVLRFINETSAVALAYTLARQRSATILVFDLGGGAFDVSILDVGEGVCEVRATTGDGQLGGVDFDQRIVQWVLETFRKSHGIDLRADLQTRPRLFAAAEQARHELSSNLATHLHLGAVAADASGPKHLSLALSRTQLEELTADLLQRCRELLQQAFSDAQLSPQEIDEVILCGGVTRMPAVREIVQQLGGGKSVSKLVDPQEAAAAGAAFQAAMLRGEAPEVLLLDVTPFCVGVQTPGSGVTRLIERNTTIPCRRVETFTTAADHQASLDLTLFQGDNDSSAGYRVQEVLRVQGFGLAPQGVPRIRVVFDIDANGILQVNARDQLTGEALAVTSGGLTNLDRQEWEQMHLEGQGVGDLWL
jgi:molecular chaperone DnaK